MGCGIPAWFIRWDKCYWTHQKETWRGHITGIMRSNERKDSDIRGMSFSIARANNRKSNTLSQLCISLTSLSASLCGPRRKLVHLQLSSIHLLVYFLSTARVQWEFCQWPRFCQDSIGSVVPRTSDARQVWGQATPDSVRVENPSLVQKVSHSFS